MKQSNVADMRRIKGRLYCFIIKINNHKGILELLKITNNVPIPVVAIGGINYDNVHKLKGLGLSGIAVISGIFDAADIKENTMRLKKKAKEEILR